MANGKLTTREIFNQLVEVQKQNVEILQQHAEILQQNAKALEGMSNRVESYNKILQNKIWYIIFACLGIAAGSIGLKVMLP